MRVESLSLQTIRKVLVVPGEREQERVRGNGEKGEREEGHPAAAAFSRFYHTRGGEGRGGRGGEKRRRGIRRGREHKGRRGAEKKGGRD